MVTPENKFEASSTYTHTHHILLHCPLVTLFAVCSSYPWSQVLRWAFHIKYVTFFFLPSLSLLLRWASLGFWLWYHLYTNYYLYSQAVIKTLLRALGYYSSLLVKLPECLAGPQTSQDHPAQSFWLPRRTFSIYSLPCPLMDQPFPHTQHFPFLFLHTHMQHINKYYLIYLSISRADRFSPFYVYRLRLLLSL